MSAPAREPLGRFDVVAVATSAGGVQALSALLGALPADFPVPVLIVQHLDPRHDTTLADILDRRSALRVKLADAGEHAEPGTAYIAPPDRHLLIGADGVLSLSDRPRTQFVRPAADLLFESVADAYGARAVVCVLTGSGRDGAAGVVAAKTRGGTVIVEDPETAAFAGMPHAAVRSEHVDHVLALADIPTALHDLLVATRP
ncbi:chemotaxis protein CheB [Actinophytocola algeriensis]|uniref:protein-glutamate methylesterase n=1 Tax=Actinophytocola algeriensis TaxID=1768010 RepID=A0A7W7VE37_9PSEU|nr:chemotaxis protein CheB [Actinophytocola algeriensis]MBB4906853.1 two-component system chemotaxis response regulator CheB [Actinophytocola algeriensis]MBE1478334.1 two-component system chemotaxis response regulator CheB [Actinophytocola algeriensis]